jgi:hypothetical protein
MWNSKSDGLSFESLFSRFISEKEFNTGLSGHTIDSYGIGRELKAGAFSPLPPAPGGEIAAPDGPS